MTESRYAGTVLSALYFSVCRKACSGLPAYLPSVLSDLGVIAVNDVVVTAVLRTCILWACALWACTLWACALRACTCSLALCLIHLGEYRLCSIHQTFLAGLE